MSPACEHLCVSGAKQVGSWTLSPEAYARLREYVGQENGWEDDGGGPYTCHVIAYYEHCIRADRYSAHIQGRTEEMRRRCDLFEQAIRQYARLYETYNDRARSAFVKLVLGDEHAW